MAQIRINVTDEEHRHIKTACAANGETMTEVGRRLLLKYVIRREQEQRERATVGDRR